MVGQSQSLLALGSPYQCLDLHRLERSLLLSVRHDFWREIPDIETCRSRRQIVYPCRALVLEGVADVVAGGLCEEKFCRRYTFGWLVLWDAGFGGGLPGQMTSDLLKGLIGRRPPGGENDTPHPTIIPHPSVDFVTSQKSITN